MLGKIFKKKQGVDNLYTKISRYSVNYQVKISNLAAKENKVDIILPFPSETPYQKMLGQFKITPKTGQIKKESKLQNKYIHWAEVLKLNTKKVFELSFEILVKPRTTALKSDDKSVANFLKSDEFININKKVLRTSKDLVRDITDIEEKVKVLNNFVIKNLQYGNPIEGLYSSDDALRKEKVDCGGFNTLLAALCIASGIPARLISGFFAGFGPNQMHAWLEIFLPTKGWVVADPSIEKLSMEGRTKKFAKLGFVGSDRIALSVGHNFKIKIGNRFLSLAILQNPKVLAEGKISYELTFEARTLK